ncbi:MAG: outer membrane protein assembly factor BamB [Thiobacillaceae bacterium]
MLFPALGMTVALSLAGCSTIGGWFGSGEAKIKPAELPTFQPSASMTRLWEVNVGTGLPYTFTPGSDGQAVYAAGRDGRILKIDAATGRELWRIETGRRLSAGVGVGEGLVLVGTPKGEVLAYRAADGQPAWTAQLSGEILAPPQARGGLVAVRGNDGKVWALDAADGKRRWVYSRALPALALRDPGSLVLGDRAVYAGFPGGRLAALSLANGAPIWETNVALPKGATELERIADVTGALALSERLVCAGAFQGRVACFDRINGQGVWGRDISVLRGVAMDQRQLYAADSADTVHAFDRERGVSPWKQDKLRDRRLSTPLPLDRHVAVGDYQGYVHLLDSETGAFAARIGTDGSPITAAPIALPQGLVVQTANGGVYAFKINSQR